MSALAEVARQAVPRMPGNYVPELPSPPQQVFLLLDDHEEVFYGGAAGGGKSSALLMAALQYIDVPGYSALLLRRSFSDLEQPGALMDRARTWLSGTDAYPRAGGRRWIFPSGARIVFGYVSSHNDVLQYQSAEYQFIGIDELTEWEKRTYQFLFSRLRRPRNVGQLPPSDDGVTLADVPLRMRSASNPGGPGHEWVKDHFVDRRTRADGVIFVPARVEDNPALDTESYLANLARLDPVDAARLAEGDWDVEDTGDVFDVGELGYLDEQPRKVIARVRYWDLAATEPSARNADPDWTVGALLAVDQHRRPVIEDVVRLRGEPSEVAAAIRSTAEADGYGVPIRIEQEPGSSGKAIISYYTRALAGFDVGGDRNIVPHSSVRSEAHLAAKVRRARPFAAQVNAGNVLAVRGKFLHALLAEMRSFPASPHDDQVDACSGAFNWLVAAGMLDGADAGPASVPRGDDVSPVVL